MGLNNSTSLEPGPPHLLALSRLCHITCRIIPLFYSRGNALLYFLVYVDDLIIIGSEPSLVNNIKLVHW